MAEDHPRHNVTPQPVTREFYATFQRGTTSNRARGLPGMRQKKVSVADVTLLRRALLRLAFPRLHLAAQFA